MSLADLIGYRKPGRAGGELSQLSQLSQGIPRPILPHHPPQPGLLLHIDSKEILSLSCARESESEGIPPATLATLATLEAAEAGSPPSLALLTEAPATQAPPRRLWLVTHADGRLVSHSFCPPATEAELWAWFPEALAIEPEEDTPEEDEPPPDPEAWPIRHRPEVAHARTEAPARVSRNPA